MIPELFRPSILCVLGSVTRCSIQAPVSLSYKERNSIFILQRKVLNRVLRQLAP